MGGGCCQAPQKKAGGSFSDVLRSGAGEQLLRRVTVPFLLKVTHKSQSREHMPAEVRLLRTLRRGRAGRDWRKPGGRPREEGRTSSGMSGSPRLPAGGRTLHREGLEADKTRVEEAGILSEVARVLLHPKGSLAPPPLEWAQLQGRRSGMHFRGWDTRVVFRSCCSREQ